MSKQQESFIKLGKELGKKEMEEKQFKQIIDIIDGKLMDEKIFDKSININSLSPYEFEKKSNDDNMIEFYKLALYYKNQQFLKMSKEYRILNDTYEDCREQMESDSIELDELENKNKSLFNRVTYLRKVAVDKNIYIYFIEKLFLFFILLFFILDFTFQAKYSYILVQNMTQYNYTGIFINTMFSLVMFAIWYLRPKVKKFKID